MELEAARLLRRQYRSLLKTPLEGILATPLAEDIFTWDAQITGLKDTPWQEGTLYVRLQFGHTYNALPPDVFFYSVPYHPNIHPNTGRPCLALLDDAGAWNDCADGGVEIILLSLQQMLCEPLLEDAVHEDAARTLMQSPSDYAQLVDKCILNSQTFLDQFIHKSSNDAATVTNDSQTLGSRSNVTGYQSSDAQLSGDDPTAAGDMLITNVSPDSTQPATATSQAKPKTVSYLDYLDLWRGQATTRPDRQSKLPHANLLHKDNVLRAEHVFETRSDLEQSTKERMKYYNSLKYGKIPGLADKVDNPKLDPNKHRLDRLQFVEEVRQPPPAPPEKPRKTLRTIVVRVDQYGRQLPPSPTVPRCISIPPPAPPASRQTTTTTATDSSNTVDPRRDASVTAADGDATAGPGYAMPGSHAMMAATASDATTAYHARSRDGGVDDKSDNASGSVKPAHIDTDVAIDLEAAELIAWSRNILDVVSDDDGAF
eukprot:scpid18310/ scgid31603/ Ubiquitin-conjugating enzyme E2 U; Ubiquitin carrier protein U; Ubiquitin-protein ligase U